MSARLLLGEDMETPQAFPVAGGLACVFTARRPGRETANEDALAVIPGANGCGVLAVADGLGGQPAGDRAAATALQMLAEGAGGQAGDQLQASVLAALDQANTALLEDGRGSGTTVAVAVIDGDRLHACIVGDSMVVVCGQRGRLKYRSVAHSPVGHAEAAGHLGAAEAMFHPDRHYVSNVLGMRGMRVEAGPSLRLAPRDTVIIGSDGLFDNLYVEEVIEQVRKGPLPAAAARLLAVCRTRMEREAAGQPHKPDDLAFILYRRQ